MEEKPTNKKEIFIVISVLLGCVSLTAASFCIYYLVKPQNTFVLAAICLVDFAYSFFSFSILLKGVSTTKWLLKGFLCAVGYIVIFIIVALFLIIFSLMFDGASSIVEFIKNNFLAIVFYAFFTAPCALIILPLLSYV